MSALRPGLVLLLCMCLTRSATAESAPVPTEAQLVLSTTAMRGYRVTVRSLAGEERVCPKRVTSTKPCIVTLPPGPLTVAYENGATTRVDAQPGVTKINLKKDPWMLTLPGILVMSGGLVLEIVGAAADNVPLVVSGLLVMGVGAGTLLVGVAVPRTVVEVKHDEFHNVARALDVPAPPAWGAALTLRF